MDLDSAISAQRLRSVLSKLKLVAAARWALGLLLLLPALAPAQQVAVQAHELTNGMRVLLVERHDEPSISGGWVAHVGSANERPGITGITHLFEHMMFKGTRTIGTQDYERDQAIIQRQEEVRSAIRQEEARLREAWRRGEIEDPDNPDSKTERLKALEEEFRALVTEQRDLLVKNEFDRIYKSAGGSGMNAFTAHDLTGYFITVPANKLELWAWMESERILDPVFREFYSERDVVFEERRMRTESTPLGRFAEEYESMIWTSHPYQWPVVGWPSDIPAITKSDADQFLERYYSPPNITLILVGDFKSDAVMPLIRRYFGRIPRRQDPPAEVVTREVPQLAERRMYAEAEANPSVTIAWQAVPFGHKDSYALNILAQLLSTRTGRLYKGLVLGQELALSADAQPDTRRWAGTFRIDAEVREPHTPEAVELGVYRELDRLKTEPVPEYELQKVKNMFAAYEYRRLTSNMSILIQLIFYDGMGDWRYINEAGAKHQAVTAEDIQRVANKYFTKETRNVAIYTRKAESPATEPDPQS